MASFSSADIKKIRQSAIFLRNIGYKETLDDDIILYANEKYQFILVNTRYGEPSDIVIKFLKENKSFSIGWIEFVKNPKQIEDNDTMGYLVYLLDFIKRNYNDVVNIDFCKKCMVEVEKYIKSQRK